MKLLALLVSIFFLFSTSAQAQDWAKERLEKSPRHLDWVTLKSGARSFKAFIAYPEVSHKSAAIVMVHENIGLTNWAREMADELASQGYIVITPDMLDSKIYTQQGDARQAVAALPPEQVTEELNAAADYVSHLPSANGKLIVVGFCWGGGQAFRYATNNPNLQAAFVFYGTPPQTADMTRINAPVYGFYGAKDNRVTATVEGTRQAMKQADKRYAPEIFPDAGHGFMRAGEAPDAQPGNKLAREKAWSELVSLLANVAN